LSILIMVIPIGVTGSFPGRLQVPRLRVVV